VLVPTTEETTQYFDAKSIELRRGNLIDKWSALAPLFEGVPSGSRVVECGAGTGLYTLPLARAGYRVTAIDLSHSSLEELQAAASAAGAADRVQCRTGDFSTVASELAGSADVVTFIKVLHHFPDRDAIREAAGVAWRALRDGGRIVVFEPNGSSPMWPVVLGLRGRRVWNAERNTFLIRRRFLDEVFSALPGARVRRGYRYLIPGTVATRAARLDELDRVITSRRSGVRAWSANLWYVVEKDHARPGGAAGG
jgi:SAM-dependent methyltransferase